VLLYGVDRLGDSFRTSPMEPLSPTIASVAQRLAMGEEFVRVKPKPGSSASKAVGRDDEGDEDDDEDDEEEDDEDDDDEEDVEDDEEQGMSLKYEDEEGGQRKKKKLTPKKATPAKGKAKAKAKESARKPKKRKNGTESSGEHGLTILHQSIREFMKPNPISLALLSIHLLFDVLSLVASVDGGWSFSSQWETQLATAGHQLSRAQQEDAFWSIPATMDSVRWKVTLWKLFFSATRSMLVLRCARLITTNHPMLDSINAQLKKAKGLIVRTHAVLCVQK
jgi:hypothetical protein